MPNLDKDFYLDKQGLRQLINELETNIVALEYDTTVSYTVGQYCVYENNFYRCTTATTGTWDSNDWVKVVISDEIPTIRSITTAQWEALTPEQKASGDYVITDATTVPLTAENIPYDDTVSGLTADNVQEALDELSTSTNVDADDVNYDNTTSGLTADNVQDAIDEVHTQLSAIIDVIYPVGSIYLSVTDSTADAVAARFGGTWVRIAEGETLFGYKSGDTNFGTVGGEGGNKDIDLSHSHTVNSHSHTIDNQSGYTGSVTLTANQSGVQAHGHGFTQPTVNKGKVSGGITGGGHKHTAGLSSTPYSKAYQQFGACAVAAGSSYTVPCRDGDRAWGGETSSDGHTHDLPDHSHSVSGGKVSDHTGTAAKEGHKHSLPKSTGTNNPATNNQLSTTQNILNPYITVYMYKRTA